MNLCKGGNMKRTHEQVRYLLTVLVIVGSIVVLAACATPAAGLEPAAPAEPAGDEVPVRPVRVPTSSPLCSPDNPQLTPLAELPIEQSSSSVVDGGVRYDIRYTNANRETFNVGLDSQSSDAAEAYIATVKVCFDAIEGTIDVPDQLVPLSPADTLFAVLVETLGIPSSDFWNAYFANVAGGTIANLADLLNERGIPPEEVMRMAIERYMEQASALRSQGMPLDNPDAGLEQEYSAVLFGDIAAEEYFGLDNPSDADLTQELYRERDNLSVEVTWLDGPDRAEPPYTIQFYVDPCLGKYTTQWYSWRSLKYAYARAYVTSGAASLGLWRWDGFSNRVGYATAYAPSYTPWLVDSTSQCRWYRVHVYGTQEWNCYALYGAWQYAPSAVCN